MQQSALYFLFLGTYNDSMGEVMADETKNIGVNALFRRLPGSSFSLWQCCKGGGHYA